MVDYLRRTRRVQAERRDGIRAERRALPVPALGPVGIRELPRCPARHRHLPPGQPRVPLADGVDGQGDGEEDRSPIPDTLVGTDSHTTMVNGLAVLGWGVGGIEAEAAMLGQPYLDGSSPRSSASGSTASLPEGVTATDLVLTVTADAAQAAAWSTSSSSSSAPASSHLSLEDTRDDRQHGAGVRRHLRLLPDRRGHAATISTVDRPRAGADRAGRSLRQGAGHLPYQTQRPTRTFTDTLSARPHHRRAVARRTEASAGSRRSRRTRIRSFEPRAAKIRDINSAPMTRRTCVQRRRRTAPKSSSARPSPGRSSPRPRQRRDRGDHLVHQHLEPERADRGRPPRARRRARRASPPSRG